VGFLYALTGTLNMADLAVRLSAETASPLFAGGVVFIVVGLAIKIGLFPLHAWLPDAYGQAPAPVASLIAPVGTKASAYVLARTLLYVVPVAESGVREMLAWVGGVAVVAGGVMAVRQVDARRMLGYSSVSHMGYIVLGLGLANGAALAGAYLHILNHAVMKAALFIAVGAAALRGHGVGLGALGRGMPITATCAVIAALSTVGVPPAGGFFSKWYLLQGAIEAGQPGLVAAILLGSLLAAVYMYRLTERVWFPGPSPPLRSPEAPGLVLAGLVVLAAAVVAVGVSNVAIVEVVAGSAISGAR
jgi:multicomponent Na+:H+ antiporter subunit D